MREAFQAIRQYKKSLIKYSIITLVFCFGLGIPGALWSIRMISGKHKNMQEDTTTLLKNEAQPTAKAAIKTRFTH
ncbi:MAG: hypothetical protein WCI00_02515 [bacterium]